MTLQNKVDQFINDTDIAHQIIHGTRTAVVETDNGPVRTLANAIGTVENLGERMTALEDGQSAGRIVKATWAILLTVQTTAEGSRGATVIADSGTHVDPVSGVQVPNNGEYTEHAQGWRWERSEALATKASRADVAAVAGTISSHPVPGGYLEVDSDMDGNVAFAVHPDGTREFIRSKVGGLTITRAGDTDAAVEVSGVLDWRGQYLEFPMVLDGPLASAIEVHVDNQFNVGYVRFADGTEWRPGDADIGDGTGGRAELLEMISLPDTRYPNNNGGFTCTGLDRITTGKYRGCWLVGNDGRLLETDTEHRSSIVILSPDLRRVVREVFANDVYTGVRSIQGVCWDSSDSTLWFVDKTNKTLRHMTPEGMALGDEIRVPHTPNGLARDATTDELISPGEGTTSVHYYSCATGLLLRTVSGIATDADQLYFDPVPNELWATRGNNGADGQLVIYSHDMTVKRTVTLEGSQAIEGIHYDGTVITVVNDGAFHTSANPPLALANKYALKGN